MNVSRQPIHALTSAELVEQARVRLCTGHGFGRRVYRHAMHQGSIAPAELGLGPRACDAWVEAFSLELPDVVRVQSDPGALGVTSKVALRLADGLEVEAVSIPMGQGRVTLCVSSQVGCKMGCTFCETGRMGLLRQLRTEEIIGQLLVTKHVLGWPVRNVVFMGMGEALDNADHVLQALRVMNDPGGLAIAQERITICTVGHLAGIARLAAEGMRRLNLSISLNAATDDLRSELMPINRRTDLASLQQALLDYRPRRNFALGVNYCLLPGINDSLDDVRAIADFCAPLGRVLVNVIPYNPGSAPIAAAPDEDEIDRFIGWLRAEGLPVRRRATKGRSVMAACGQLGNPEARRLRKLRTFGA